MGYSVRHYGRSRTKKNGRKYKDWYVIVSRDGEEIENIRAEPNTEATAKKLKFAKMQELHVGNFVASADDMTFDEVARLHQEYFHTRTEGPNADRSDLTSNDRELRLDNHFLPEFGHLPFSKVPPLLPDYVVKLKKEHGPNTVHNMYRHLTSVFGFAHKRLRFPDLLQNVHVDLPPKRARTAEEIIKFEEFFGLLESLETRPKEMPKLEWLQDTGMVCLAGLLGLRVGEIAGLNCEDIDLDNWTVNIQRQFKPSGRFGPPKYNSYRKVDMDPISHKLFSDYRDFLGAWSGPLFCGPFGRLSNVGIKIRFRRLVIAAELKNERGGAKYSPHIFRHFAGSLWISQGVDIEKVSRQLGHKDINVTHKIYLHEIEAREDRGRTAMRSLGGAFPGMRASLPPPVETRSMVLATRDAAPVMDRVVKTNGTVPVMETPSDAPQWVPYALRLFQDGWQVWAVVEELGISHPTLLVTFNRLGLPTPRNLSRSG